jgi:hypothetical protein
MKRRFAVEFAGSGCHHKMIIWAGILAGLIADSVVSH